jgi:CRISPR/Cas system-associated endonuclease Cas1
MSCTFRITTFLYFVHYHIYLKAKQKYWAKIQSLDHEIFWTQNSGKFFERRTVEGFLNAEQWKNFWTQNSGKFSERRTVENFLNLEQWKIFWMQNSGKFHEYVILV